MSRATALTLGLAVAAIACAAPSAGAADWSPPQDIPAEPVGPVRLAADDTGAAVLAWGEIAGAGVIGKPLYGALRIAMRPAGGRFTAPSTLSSTKDDGRAFALGVGAGGTAIAVWRVQPAQPGRLRVAIGRAGRGFGVHATLRGTGTLPPASNSAGRAVASEPALAVAPDGTAVVAWLARGRRGCGDVVMAAMRRAGHAFDRGRRISPPCPHAWHPVAALDASGAGVVAWRAGARCGFGEACGFSVGAAPIAERRFLAPRTLSRDPVAALSPAAGAGGGRTLVVWRDFVQAQRTGTIGPVVGALARIAGRFGAPARISTSERIGGIPQAALDRAGRAAVTWYEGDDKLHLAPRIAVGLPGEPFQGPQPLSPTSLRLIFDPAPQVGWDAAGTAIVAYPAVAPPPNPNAVPALWASREMGPPFAVPPPPVAGYNLGPVALAGDGELLVALTRGNAQSRVPGMVVAIRPGRLTEP